MGKYIGEGKTAAEGREFFPAGATEGGSQKGGQRGKKSKEKRFVEGIAESRAAVGRNSKMPGKDGN